MKRLTSIVAISSNGAIGCNNELPWKLKSDLKFFKDATTGNTVLMGRKTYDSIGSCLPNRHNIILSHNYGLFPSTDECQITLSLAEALYAAQKIKNKEVFVVGGASVYSQIAPYVDRYLVTIVDKDIANADAFLDERIRSDLTNEEAWKKALIFSGEAKAGVDEAPFEIYELTLIADAEVRAKRNALINEYKQLAQPTKRKSSGSSPRPDKPINEMLQLGV